MEDFAHDVPLLLDALGVDRAVIAGHSGVSERVAGLVLEASPTTLVGNAELQGLSPPFPIRSTRTLPADSFAVPPPPAICPEGLWMGWPTSCSRCRRAAELVVFRGLGHTPRWEDPARFAGELATFAARLPRSTR